jgi:MoaA/NifB/PqqE/SkfB family radical SAM enzyme
MPDNQYEEVPFLSNVGLLLTYKCTISCPHCIVKAGPLRTEEMSLEKAFAWLDQLRKYKNGFIFGISLTGGEPFYNLDHLIKIADHANELGFIVSVVSNAYWAQSKEEALSILTQCSSIQMVSISSDIPHQKLLPFENVKNAIWAAKKLGKLYNIAVATERDDDPDYLSLIDRLLDITDKDHINTSFILPVGRAERKIKNGGYILSSEPSAYACSMASFPVIFPDGTVIACIGPPIVLPRFNPLNLGNINKESITEIFDRAESNYILHAIRTFGPKSLVDLIKENGFETLLPEKYIKDATCDVCYKILSDRQICNLLKELIPQNEKFRMKTAYGRYYHMHEDEMLKRHFSIAKS